MATVRSNRLSVEDNLGDLVRRMFLVRTTAIDNALERQKITGEKVGEALVANGAITADQLASVVRLQTDLRSGEAKRALRALDELADAASATLRQTQEDINLPKTDPRGVDVRGLWAELAPVADAPSLGEDDPTPVQRPRPRGTE